MSDEDAMPQDAGDHDEPRRDETAGDDVAGARRRARPTWNRGAHGRGVSRLTSSVLPLAAIVGAAVMLTQTHELPLRIVLVASAVAGLAVVAMEARTDGRSWRRTLAGQTSLLVVVVTGCWVGANSAQVTWFGHQVGHGPRDRAEVSITFDDGPNIGATLAIRDILDAHGVKGTFFEVGKAVDRRPDIGRALFADGHLIGNHSYHHDSGRWLDPRYLELMAAQRSIAAAIGACPAFFRAPHGQHTPFMAHVVHAHGLVMAGWDVSAGDWVSQDPAALARKVLARVRPGSIIDLHDGLDGNVLADRTVLVRALPLILDGLEARHLRAVRLDVLLSKPAYLAGCRLAR